ncbi:MAG: type II toxin-antitoxin system VapB family antitoxin [Myxococcaceae bacterium]
MRTTIELNDELLRKAKRRAADLGTTLRDVVEQALRSLLEAQNKRPRGYTLKWKARGGGTQPGVSFEDWNALRDRMDGVR